MNSKMTQSLQPSSTQHAIVIGGSIAGMMMARVLTHYFAQVTIIERDRLPETPEFRKGAMCMRVLYSQDRPTFDPMHIRGNSDALLKSLATKADCWRYEQEWRELAIKAA